MTPPIISHKPLRVSLAAASLAASLTSAGCQQQPTAQPSERDRAFQQVIADYDRDIAIQRVKIIILRDGEAAANLYMKCQQTPPRQSANQKRCNALMERLKREDAAYEATEKEKEKNW